MGEEMADSILRTNETSTVSVRIFYMPQSYDMGQTVSAGFEPANLGRPLKPHCVLNLNITESDWSASRSFLHVY
jgi:hypothetical protein